MQVFKRIALAVSIVISSFLVISCTEVPITGRQQLNIVPDESLNQMAAESYRQFMQENKISDNAAQRAMVNEVGTDVAAAVEEYARRNDLPDILDYNWEFNLIEDDAVNAWAMPGGKVVVYEGIMDVAGDRAGLAVVMAHEIAHVVAEHGSERVSQQLLVQAGGIALSSLVGDPQTREIVLQSYGAGAQYGVILPYSRVQEKEADRLGLIFMAMAGYDPQEAVNFWQRMTAQKSGGQVPEFLSTHPSDQTRIENIRDYIPEAKRYYRQ